MSKIFAILACLIVFAAGLSEYRVINQSKSSSFVSLTLQYFGKDQYYLKPTSPIIRRLNFLLIVHTYNDFSFKITDADKKRYQVPQYKPFPVDPFQNFTFPIAASTIEFFYNSNPFDFKIVRKDNGAVLFSTFNKTIIYSDYYIQIGTELQSRYIFGLGQRLAQSFVVKDGTWTIFNRDRGEIIDTGVGIQTYSYYPFYLMKDRETYHLSHYRTSSALDAIKEQIDGIHSITYKSIGGIIDFRFFVGDQNPETIIQRFSLYNGRADLPPFWSFGYHQCRWGYQNISQLREVASKFHAYDIPLDTLWSDLDYMINSEVFTIDESRFPPDEMRKLLEEYRWIPIIDPGIKNSGPLYEQGLRKYAFMLDADNKKPFLGKMRAGRTVYPDFFHPNASNYWAFLLDNLYQKVPFSGVWLDSNEFTSFCQGVCEPPQTPSKFDYGKDLPYSPGIDALEGDMPALNCTHFDGLIQADVHVYNGFLESVTTYDYLQSKGMKPFILTRSSTFGSSKYAIHWSGDNAATWEFLKSSIVDNFNNQLWGQQIVGADICGFADNTTDELCARWYQLGSFYPFSRNHNEKSSRSQQPYALGDMTLSAARNNLKLRYGLLKHIYTIFLAKQGLGTIWKPLFFVFPKAPKAFLQEYMETEFMFGNDLLFTPLLQAGKNVRQAYFPQIGWYCLKTGEYLKEGVHTIQNEPSEMIPAFIREDSIIFYQDTEGITKTSQLGSSFTIIAGMRYDQQTSNAIMQYFTASGEILSINDYNDDEALVSCSISGCKYKFFAILAVGSSKSLTLKVDFEGGSKLNEEVSVEALVLYYHDNKIVHSLDAPLKIKGSTSFTIPLPASDLRGEAK